MVDATGVYEDRDPDRLQGGGSSSEVTGEVVLLPGRSVGWIVNANGCWLWTGAKSYQGYGWIGVGRSSQRAHRYVYELYRGPIPEGLVLDHLCREKSCVFPDHLEPVTQIENVHRAMEGSCTNGHEFSPENTYMAPTGTRHCRTCRSATQRRRYAMQKEGAR